MINYKISDTNEMQCASTCDSPHNTGLTTTLWSAEPWACSTDLKIILLVTMQRENCAHSKQFKHQNSHN